ncbi:MULTISPECIES: type II toxin-antitoxin system RelE family toxin [Streptomyces]|uniref:type II toxin-antitoxin system RelE family toxin n=1 Tax=Streptomyces TaxID=1883 RepID=UPI000F709AB3|nr:type II toxin-antitoxin system RelE/ParE family toxin [Streptomyces sp. W1SF4]AZM92764.1 type II toxin-antitoxin system RelE/ParE family toxin [Streptomyces sp. W1SF4]
MAYPIVWNEAAVSGAARHLADDPAGLRQLLRAVDLLSGEPRPPGAAAHGPRLCRIHVGRYRVLYTVTRRPLTVTVLHVGRLG